MVWARWGATKFQRYQFCGLAYNKLAEEHEPRLMDMLDDGKRILK